MKRFVACISMALAWSFSTAMVNAMPLPGAAYWSFNSGSPDVITTGTGYTTTESPNYTFTAPTEENLPGIPTFVIGGTNVRSTGAAGGTSLGNFTSSSETVWPVGRLLQWERGATGNSVNNYFTLIFDSTGFQDFQLYFQYRLTNGMTYGFSAIEYSLDEGGTYQSTGVPLPALTANSNWHAVDIDFSALNAIENQSNVFLRFTLPDLPNNDNSFRLDNLQLTSEPPQGDFDGDGDVDGADFVVWQTNFPTTSGALAGDSDGDTDVDGADFAAWQNQFPSGSSSSVTPIPEPMSLVLLLGTSGIMLLVARRNQLQASLLVKTRAMSRHIVGILMGMALTFTTTLGYGMPMPGAAYWSFNNGSPDVIASGSAYTTTESPTYTFSPPDEEDLPGAPAFMIGGTNVRSQGTPGGTTLGNFTSTSGTSWSVGRVLQWERGSTGNSVNNSFTLMFDSTGFEDFQLYFQYRLTNGMTYGISAIDYSLDDGGTYQSAEVPLPALTANSSWHALTFDFSALDAIEDQSSVFLRFSLPDMPNNDNSFRLDNLQLTSMIVPEPSTIALSIIGFYAMLRRICKQRTRA